MQGMETAYVGNGVSASEASTTVGTEVIKAVAQKYQTNNQIGKATVEIDGFGTVENVTGDATVSVYTTDFEVEGTITLEDGILSWGEIEELTPGLTLKTTSLILAPGENGTIRYKLRGVNGNISWISNNGKIAVVNGVVTIDSTADETDTAIITASIGEYTKTCSVTVQEKWNDATIEGLNRMIGTEIANNSYTANGVGEWQLFYADSGTGVGTEEVFIISKNILETNTAINGQNGSYSGTANFRTPYATEQDLSYGTKWNARWLAECSGNESESNNALTVAYLCDSKKWERYKIGPATYAVGGPTMEMLVDSIKEKTGTDYSSSVTVSNTGYGNGSITGLAEPYKAKFNASSYGNWWLASPSNSNGSTVRFVSRNGEVIQYMYYEKYSNCGVRPLVSIPLSKVKVKGTQVKVVP